MAEANISQGVAVHSGLYRVPDLLTESQFIQYMKDMFNVEVIFNHLGSTGTPDSENGPTGLEPAEAHTDDNLDI